MVGRRTLLSICGGTFGALALGGCGRMRSMGLPELEGGAPLGLKSSGGWTFFTVKPPHIIGPNHSLRLERGFLRGSILETSVQIEIRKNFATGMTGPRSVELDIFDEGERFALEGTWDGARTRLEARGGKLDATIPILSRDASVGIGFAPSGSRSYCDYHMRERDPQHLVGRTTCGFNSDVLLEIAPQIPKWLSRSELGVVLVALMSSASHG